MYRKTLQTSVAAAALFAFAAPFAGPASAAGNTIVNGKSQVKIAITGQLSRVVAIVNDGDRTISRPSPGNRGIPPFLRSSFGGWWGHLVGTLSPV